MKAMRIVLASVYVVLIALLILLGMRGCEKQEQPPVEPKPTEDSIPAPPRPPIEPVDTDSVSQQHRDSIYERAQEIGGNGDYLKVTLQWHFKGDLDLHALLPDGTHVYYNNLCGILNVDNYGRKNSRRFGENMRWNNPPPKGRYKFYVQYFSSSNAQESGTCYVTVMKNGQQHAFYEFYMDKDKAGDASIQYLQDVIIE